MNRYRLFQRRNGIFFLQDNKTSRQESLRTRSREDAERIAFHRNESARIAAGHRQIAVGYLQVADPEIKTRNWADVMVCYCALPGKAATQKRKAVAMKDEAFNPLRSLPLIETTPQHFLAVLQEGTVSTNSFLRKLHNLARRMKWLPDDILSRGAWPVVRYGQKRAITVEEHQRILGVTPTEERRLYYQLLWETGASQSDVARLTAESIDWEVGAIRFHRLKLDGRSAGDVFIVMGPSLERLIAHLPQKACSFPLWLPSAIMIVLPPLASIAARQGLKGVTLHSYRYVAIQRAKACGYNKRHAMAMAGHLNESVHDQYAEGGAVVIPSLEEVEVAFQAAQAQRVLARKERQMRIISIQQGIQRIPKETQADVG